MPDRHSNVNGRLRVLVVEDEWLVADYIVDILEEAGHEVVATVATGEKALEHWRGPPLTSPSWISS
jgi:CheY-like chemotaxis protein